MTNHGWFQIVLIGTCLAAPQTASPAIANDPATTPTAADTAAADSAEAASAELDALLRDWEQASSGILNVEVRFDLFIYDKVFSVEKRGTGRAYFEGPQEFAYVQRPVQPLGEPGKFKKFKLEPAGPFSAIFTANWSIVNNGETEQRIEESTPEPRRFEWGEPWRSFLMSIDAGRLRQTYDIRLVGRDSQRVLLELRPLAKPKPRHWLDFSPSQFEAIDVMLDPQSFRLKAIRGTDLSGNQTVYVVTGMATNTLFRPGEADPFPRASTVTPPQTSRQRRKSSRSRSSPSSPLPWVDVVEDYAEVPESLWLVRSALNGVAGLIGCGRPH